MSFMWGFVDSDLNCKQPLMAYNVVKSYYTRVSCQEFKVKEREKGKKSLNFLFDLLGVKIFSFIVTLSNATIS